MDLMNRSTDDLKLKLPPELETYAVETIENIVTIKDAEELDKIGVRSTNSKREGHHRCPGSHRSSLDDRTFEF